MKPSVQSVGGVRPRVSVVIPAFNYAKYLPVAIDSVLAQTFIHREIIVVDDGSTDETPSVVGRYGASVRYIHQKNAGLPSARNTGIEAALGEFVAFLDADDQWLPTLLDQAMATFDRLPSEYAIVAFRRIFVDANGEGLGLKRLAPELDEEIRCEDIVFKSCFPPSGVVARRAAIQACGCFNPILRSSEDRDMWIRVASRYRVFLHRERLAIIRRHNSNMSRNADRMRKNTGQVLKNAYQQRLVPRRRIIFWLRVYSFFNFQSAWMYYEEGRPGAAIRDILRSLALWPFFTQPRLFNEPLLFRIRSLVRFGGLRL